LLHTHTHTHSPGDTSLLLSTATALFLHMLCAAHFLSPPVLLLFPFLSQVLLNLSFSVDSFFIFVSLALSVIQPYFFFTSHFCLFSLYFLSISPYAAASVRSISDLPGLGFHGDGHTEALWWPTLFLIADSPVTADGRQLYRHPDCIYFVKGRLDSTFAYHLNTFASASSVR